MTSILDIQDRIIAIGELLTLPGYGQLVGFRSEDDCGFTDAELPAWIVLRSRAPQYVYNARRQVMITREFYGRLYCEPVCDTTRQRKPAELDNVADIMEALPIHFLAYPELQLNDMGIVRSARIVQDSGDVTMFGVDTSKWAGVQYRFSVVYDRSIYNTE
jgi:hypothetical protein